MASGLPLDPATHKAGRRAFLAGLGTAAAIRPGLAAPLARTGAQTGAQSGAQTGAQSGAQTGAQTGATTLTFQVCRNGSPIGTHRLDFNTHGTTTRVRIDATFRIGIGFLTLYRYRHQGMEIWRDGAFQSLDTTTDDNGTSFRVQAARAAAGILIKATGLPDRLAPANTLPLTHWAEAAMSAPLFNPQTGAMLRETAQPRGQGTVTLANGKPIEATGYALKGEAPIEDWYDEAKIWAALDATGKDGSAITYRRV